jgi:hypothetical protein
MSLIRKMTFRALAVGALLGFGTAGPASADVIDYELTVDGCSGSGCGLLDYGTVEVSDIGGGGVHVSVSLVDDVNFLVNALYFSLDGSPNLTLANISSPFAQDDVTGNAIPDNFTIGLFGWFDYTILCTAWNGTTNPTGCGPGASHSNHGPLEFDITNASVTTAAFLSGTGNPGGTGADTNIFFVVDIASFLSSGTLTGQVGAPAGIIVECLPGIDCVNVPEPITLSVFGAGLAGAAALRRRRKKAA